MAKLSDSASTEIDAPIDAVWAIVADVATWPQWQATLGALEILETDADERVTLCAVEFDARVTKIKMKLRCSYEAPARTSLATAWRRGRPRRVVAARCTSRSSSP